MSQELREKLSTLQRKAEEEQIDDTIVYRLITEIAKALRDKDPNTDLISANLMALEKRINLLTNPAEVIKLLGDKLDSTLKTIQNNIVTAQQLFGLHPCELLIQPDILTEIEKYIARMDEFNEEAKGLLAESEELNKTAQEKVTDDLKELQAKINQFINRFNRTTRPLPKRIKTVEDLERLVADHKEQINLQGNRDKTLLIEFAARGSDVALIKYLLENGADINAQGDAKFERGNTALHWLLANAYVNNALWLVENGPKYHINFDLFGHGQTALHLAIAKGPNHVTDQPKRGNPQVPDGFRNIIKALIKNGASVNIKDQTNGFTPLHLAVLHRDMEIIELLLGQGADTALTDNGGRTPLDMLKLPYNEANKILKSQGAVITMISEAPWNQIGPTIQDLFQQPVAIEDKDESESESKEEVIPVSEPPLQLPPELANLKTHADKLTLKHKNQKTLGKANAINEFIKEYKNKKTPEERLEFVERKLENPKDSLLQNTGTGFYKVGNIFFFKKHFNKVDPHHHLSNSKTEDLLLELKAQLKS